MECECAAQITRGARRGTLSSIHTHARAHTQACEWYSADVKIKTENKNDRDERETRRGHRRCLHGKYPVCALRAHPTAYGPISMDAVWQCVRVWICVCVFGPRVKRRITMRLRKNQNMHFLFTHCVVYARSVCNGMCVAARHHHRHRCRQTIVQNNNKYHSTFSYIYYILRILINYYDGRTHVAPSNNRS